MGHSEGVTKNPPFKVIFATKSKFTKKTYNKNQF